MAKMLNKVDRSVGFEAWNRAKWFMVLLKDGRTRCGCQSLVDDDDEENYIWCFILLLLLVICILAILVVLAILVIIVVLIVILIVAIIMMRVFVVIIVIRLITIIIATIDIVAVIIFFHMIFFLTIILMFHFHFYHVFFSEVRNAFRGPEAYGANYSKTMKHALDEAVAPGPETSAQKSQKIQKDVEDKVVQSCASDEQMPCKAVVKHAGFLKRFVWNWFPHSLHFFAHRLRS